MGLLDSRPMLGERWKSADTIVIAPSNPIVSIGPIRALPGVDELLAARRTHTVAVSPIVGGAALKGPADRMLVELGHEASVVGVARLYAPIASALVIDTIDADSRRRRRSTGDAMHRDAVGDVDAGAGTATRRRDDPVGGLSRRSTSSLDESSRRPRRGRSTATTRDGSELAPARSRSGRVRPDRPGP